MLKTVTRLSRATDAIAVACEYLSRAILLIWVAVITVGVVMRYVFAAPLLFQVDLVSGLLAVFATLGFAGVMVREQHIRVDLLTRHFAPRLQQALVALTHAVTFGFALAMIWASKNLVYISFRMGSRFDVSGLPVWPFQAAFIFGFVLLALAALMRLAVTLLTPAPHARALGGDVHP